MNRLTRAIVAWGSWLVLGILIADAFLVDRDLRTISRSNDSVERTWKVITVLEATISALKDAETGQRGFLLTGRDEYLLPYQLAGDRIQEGLARLLQLTSENHEQRARLDILRELAGAKLAELRETIVLRGEKGLGRALEVVQTDRGRNLMISIRELAAEIHFEENKRLNDKLARSKMAVWWTVLTFSLTTGLSLGLLVLVLWLQRLEAAEKEKTAATIRENEAWLSTTLASVGDALIATDQHGVVRFINPVAESLTGWPNHEAAGQSMETVFQIINEFTRAPAESPIARVIREGRVVGLANHTVLIARGGAETPIEDSAAPIFDGRGAVAGVVMVFRDITVRRKAELALKESEARKAAILEAALDCIITVDQNARVIEINPAAETIFRRGRDRSVGQLLTDLIVPVDSRDEPHKGIGHYFDSGDDDILGKRIEATGIRADGSRFPVELAVAKIKNDGPPLFTAYLRDIEAKKRAEAEQASLLNQLEAERRHLETLIESSQDCIKELDLDGRILRMNKQGHRLLEIQDPSYVLEKIWVELWNGPDREAVAIAVAKAAAGGVGSFEGYCPTETGRPKWWDVVVTPIKDAQGRPERLLAISRDITERRLHADERERLLIEAQEANHAKSLFLAILSHELRTPLNPILLAVSSMIDRLIPPEELRPTLEMIRHNVNLQVMLIDDLLDVMRIVQGKMPLHWGVADCHEVIHHALEVCQSEVFGKVIELKLDLAAKDHFVNADAARLQQVFWNLIKNAVKFSPQGGTITIRTRQEAAAGDPGAQLAIEVEDTGIGIEPEALPQIFDPFQQGETSVTRKFGGLGLGLAICKGVIDAHGGTIRAESQGKGQGTTFKIRLNALPAPKINGQVQPLSEAAGPVTSTSGSALKILVVEDEVATRRLMARLLKGLGHQVVAEGTIAAAVAASDGQVFDLIISDIGLPDGSGLDLIRKVVAQRGKIPSIALTGYGMEEDIVRSRDAGFTTHMTKPIDFTKLEAMIRQVAR